MITNAMRRFSRKKMRKKNLRMISNQSKTTVFQCRHIAYKLCLLHTTLLAAQSLAVNDHIQTVVDESTNEPSVEMEKFLIEITLAHFLWLICRQIQPAIGGNIPKLPIQQDGLHSFSQIYLAIKHVGSQCKRDTIKASNQ